MCAMVLPSTELTRLLVRSEIDYMTDRMLAIQGRDGNPEGIELVKFGQTVCLYSKMMPWGQFNAVKGLGDEDVEQVAHIDEFYRSRERSAQFELVPGLATSPALFKQLDDLGYLQTGYHATVYTELTGKDLPTFDLAPSVEIRTVQPDEFEHYARIHCLGFGMPESGIAPIARNNYILYVRPGWRFYLAFVDGHPAAAGVLYMQDQIASLTMAATLPEYRKLGLQQHLILHRMRAAAEQGCSLLVGQCNYNSQSHRNMQRCGLELGYVRTTWTKR